MLTIVFGLAAAIGWGAPDPVLAQAVRRVGAFAVVFGSILLGTLLVAPLALFLDPPDWTERALVIAPLVGILTVLGFQAGFMSFREGAVSVVAPIIACEGGVAALFSLAGGEQVDRLVLLGLPLAVVGVVLVSRGEGESSSAGVVPAIVAAVVWGGVLALSAPIARDLGAGWAFLLVRGSAVVVCLPIALVLGSGRAALLEWWRISARSAQSWPWRSSASTCAGARSWASPSWGWRSVPWRWAWADTIAGHDPLPRASRRCPPRL